jgi:hypothetical protein
MKDIKMPMAATGVTTVSANEERSYDHSYRSRGRVGYGDRKNLGEN